MGNGPALTVLRALFAESSSATMYCKPSRCDNRERQRVALGDCMIARPSESWAHDDEHVVEGLNGLDNPSDAGDVQCRIRWARRSAAQAKISGPHECLRMRLPTSMNQAHPVADRLNAKVVGRCSAGRCW